MNTAAVLVGLLYGVISAVVCYVVSMVTSGLFARSFYRLYARVLIGICSVMLVAPGLRWVAIVDPGFATYGLTIAQYAVMGVLCYGVFRFNREHLNSLFLERKTAAYFTFGTLANAALVTLAFLHVAISQTPSWNDDTEGYIGAGHYGPLLVILAGMVFHTDYYLKQAVGDRRRFSGFTFVGYAISFLGLALSVVPYVGTSLHQLGLATVDSPLVQNFFSAQALLLAIILYAWLVWRYESIPPLFLLLLAIVGEYHVLVTQWVIQAFGPASWGLASLPLFAGLALLDRYFTYWDQRKLKSKERDQGEQPQAGISLRFATPFRLVAVGLAIALLCITLWTRLSDVAGGFDHWLSATFVVYACFFLGMAITRKEPLLIYLSGLLAALAALLGLESAGGPMSVALLGSLSLVWAGLAYFAERTRLQLEWRTPLADCSLLSAIAVTVIVFSRHLLGPHAYHFRAVEFLDCVALGGAAIAFVVCAQQYRSWLPTFAALIALATTVPPWSAAVGLFATVAAACCERWAEKKNAMALENRVRLFGIKDLPLPDVLPELFVQPLSMGAIPLAIIGLLISASHVLQANFSATVQIGAIVSAVALGLLTRTYRVTWLYVLSLVATYFAIHTVAHGQFFQYWQAHEAVSAHLLVAATISLLGWTAASAYVAWCGALLKRVAEDKESGIREKRSYHAGLLYDMVSVTAFITLVAIFIAWLSNEGTSTLASSFLFFAAMFTSVLFFHAASVYRSQVGSYLSLTALTLAVIHALAMLDLARWDMAAAAGIGLLAAACSCLAWGRHFAAPSKTNENVLWKPSFQCLEATGLELWFGPLGVYAMVCSFAAVVAVLGIDVQEWTVFNGLTTATPLTFAAAGGAFLLSTRAFRTPATYLAAIGLVYATLHATASLVLAQEDFKGQAQLVHLLLAAGLSLVSCCVAAVCASAFNTRLESADGQRREMFLKYRRFYAGTLQHFAFAASCVILFILARFVILGDLVISSAALMNICVSLLLAVTFSLSGSIYHCRTQTYCALAAVYFGLGAVVTILVPETHRFVYQTLSVSASALLMALICWLLVRLERRHEPKATDFGQRRYDCWEQPPWPWGSLNASLWARPLAHTSVFLALLAMFFVGRDWLVHQGPHAQAWLAVSTIYLAAATFLVATRTHRFGWLLPWLVLFPGTSEQEKRREAADEAEKSIHYVMFLITGALAIHLTVQLYALETLPNQLVLSWHLFLAALLALVGWSLATLGIFHYGRRLEATPDRHELRQELTMYGGLLHHVSAIAALVVFAGACGFGVPPSYLSAPLLGSISLLVLFFGLTSVTYRSQAASYLSLLAVGLAGLHLSSIATETWPTMGPLNAPAMALLGLILVSLASFATAWNKAHPAESPSGSLQPSPWLRPFSWSADSPLATWARPLRHASLFYAVVGLIMMLVHRWLLYGTWDEANGQALTTYCCVAATFAVSARLYDSALLTYGAATVVTFSAVPQLLISGLPITHLGIALSLVAVLFWLVGFMVERHCIRLHKTGSEPLAASLTRVYERPLIRCSAVLAVIAIAHSLLVWKIHGWSISQTPIVVACAVGSVTLLLNARSLNLLHRVTRARTLVYLACASLTGCSLAATSMLWNFNGLGPVAAMTALLLGIVGLLLIESSQAISESKPSTAELRRTFGEPISHFAAGLSILAVVVALIAVIGPLGLSYELFEKPAALAEFDSPPLLPTSATLLVSAAVCMLTVRAQRESNWLYAAVILGTGGLCLLAESQTDWTLTEMTVATLILMNALVALARIIGAHRASVESILGLSESNCERPFFQWPLMVTTSLLVGHVVYILYILTGLAPAGLEWPWLWVSLLAGGLFLHVLYMQTHSAYVHLLVWSTVICVVGSCISRNMVFTQDDAVVAVGFGWGALALGFLAVSRITERRGVKNSADTPFSGVGNSIITILYLLISGVAIAPVVLSSQATSVAISVALISVCWLWMAWVSGEEVLGYATVVGFFTTVVYSGHAWLGIQIIGNPLAAFFVVGYSFLLYGVNILVSRAAESKAKVLIRPTYYMALSLPIILIVAIPLDQRNPAAFALLAAGAYYLLVALHSQIRWAMYVAAGLTNVAIYLWVPAARELTGLYQLYVIPAAITVLIFAQLHRNELNAQALTSIRLTASGAILAISTLEVYFTSEPSMLQFIVVLVLSLVGIASGIALRIKPFVYVGLAFLVINVVGQLGMRFQHEGGVVRAIILIAVGLLVLGAMIFFNIHRERILRQYRGFVADKSWK